MLAAVVVVTGVEHTLGVAGGVEIEVEAYFVVAVVVLRRKSWSSLRENTHLLGLASVLAAHPQLEEVDMIGVLEDEVQEVTCRRHYRALALCIGSIGSHKLYEDGTRIGLEEHTLGSFLVMGQIEAVRVFDLKGFETAVAAS